MIPDTGPEGRATLESDSSAGPVTVAERGPGQELLNPSEQGNARPGQGPEKSRSRQSDSLIKNGFFANAGQGLQSE